MRVPRLYVDTPLAGARELTLAPEPAHHVAQVLRLRAGAEIHLFDGDGGAYRAVLTEVTRKAVRACIESFLDGERESPLRVTLVQGVSRGERMDYTLQKAVELGVDAIVPVFTERSVVRLEGERLASRAAHWQRIVIGACEQCGRNRVPRVHDARRLDEWLAQAEPAGLLLDPDAAQSLREVQPPHETVSLLIGPEGGLSERERAMAVDRGWTPVRLGPRILRTETAAVAALAAMQALWGDF